MSSAQATAIDVALSDRLIEKDYGPGWCMSPGISPKRPLPRARRPF